MCSPCTVCTLYNVSDTATANELDSNEELNDDAIDSPSEVNAVSIPKVHDYLAFVFTITAVLLRMDVKK